MSVAVISIPSLPATTPPSPTAVPQSSSSSSYSDDPNSFANYLKSVQSRQSDEQTSATSTDAKVSTGTKSTADRDTKKSDSDKKKSSLLTDTVPVPVTTTVHTAEAKTFALSFSQVRGENAKRTASQQGAQMAADDSGESQTSKADALRGSVAEAVQNAPVAFGATLSKEDVLKADGLKTGNARDQDTKVSEAKPKLSSSAETAATKNIAELSKASEGKNSSAHQQHADSSHDEEPAAGGSAGKVATGAAVHGQVEGSSMATHGAASSSNEVPTSAAVQNAYAPAQIATPVDKAAPGTSTAAVSEPTPTPSTRPQNIDLKIAGADNSQVDVRVSQRAGDVQVTVRTPDGDLAQSLRQHLPELSDRLSQAGVSGDLWQPQTAQTSNNGNSNADSRYSDDAQNQQQNQQQQARQNGGGRQQQGEAPQSAWLNELSQANKESK